MDLAPRVQLDDLGVDRRLAERNARRTRGGGRRGHSAGRRPGRRRSAGAACPGVARSTASASGLDSMTAAGSTGRTPAPCRAAWFRRSSRARSPGCRSCAAGRRPRARRGDTGARLRPQAAASAGGRARRAAVGARAVRWRAGRRSAAGPAIGHVRSMISSTAAKPRRKPATPPNTNAASAKAPSRNDGQTRACPGSRAAPCTRRGEPESVARAHVRPCRASVSRGRLRQQACDAVGRRVLRRGHRGARRSAGVVHRAPGGRRAGRVAAAGRPGLGAVGAAVAPRDAGRDPAGARQRGRADLDRPGAGSARVCAGAGLGGPRRAALAGRSSPSRCSSSRWPHPRLPSAAPPGSC